MKKTPAQRMTLTIDGSTRMVLTADRITVHQETGKIDLKCHGPCAEMKGLEEFGLRRMPSGQLRNQPQCKDCR